MIKHFWETYNINWWVCSSTVCLHWFCVKRLWRHFIPLLSKRVKRQVETCCFTEGNFASLRTQFEDMNAENQEFRKKMNSLNRMMQDWRLNCVYHKLTVGIVGVLHHLWHQKFGSSWMWDSGILFLWICIHVILLSLSQVFGSNLSLVN